MNQVTLKTQLSWSLGRATEGNAAYMARHRRVWRSRGKATANLCEGCCGSKAQDWATIHGKDGLDVNDYVPLCRKCHMQYDLSEWAKNRPRNEHGRWARLPE